MSFMVRVSAAAAAALAVLCVSALARAGYDIIGSEARDLYVMDRSTGVGTRIGPAAPAMSMNGLAFDASGRVLYGISPDKDQLFSFDPVTAAGTAIGSPGDLGFGNANGLAWIPDTGMLYATETDDDVLFTIDPLTGLGTAVASIGGGFSNVEGLAFDPSTGTLYGLAVGLNGSEIHGFGQIVVIDRYTAATTALGPTLPEAHPWRGLAFDPQTDMLVASGGQGLCFIDKTTGLTDGPIGGTYVQGLAVIPEPATVALVAVGLAAMLTRRAKTRRGTRRRK